MSLNALETLQNVEHQAYRSTAEGLVSLLQQHGNDAERAEAILIGVVHCYGQETVYAAKMDVWREFLTGTKKFQGFNLEDKFLEQASMQLKSHIRAMCQKIGQGGTVDEFENVLARFGSDPEAVEALRNGVSCCRQGHLHSMIFEADTSVDSTQRRTFPRSLQRKEGLLALFNAKQSLFVPELNQSVGNPENEGPNKKGPRFY